MADHEVRVSTKNLLIGGIDVHFAVKVDAKVLGTLSVSEGGLSWRPKHGRSGHELPISWTDFAEWAESR
jgi:hypothetical protein